MRLLTLAAASLALLVPLAAQAAWPPRAKAQYMSDCVATAKQDVDSTKATKHCTCGADVIEKQFSTAEIQQLMSTTPPPTVELRDRLTAAVQVCKAS
ncbi:hypothetical protein [Pseudomonas sp. NPDC007930]|uniref:hypothetical protein n=1 Tax=Pseudomonas sp. NPDC007930 TaxID=3364417 RepID=UPI0036E96D56